MIEIRAIKPSEHLAEITELMRDAWAEIEPHLNERGPAPVAEMYQALESVDLVVCFAAFDEQALVGCVVAVLSPHLNYGMLFAQHIALFVKPSYRSSSIGLRMISATEQAAAARGARFMFWHAKPGSSFDRICEKRSLALEERVFRKDFPSCHPQ